MSFRHQWHEEMYTVHKYWYWKIDKKCILPQVLLSCSWLSDCFPLSQVLTFAKFVPFFLAFLVMVARNCSRKSARPAALLQQGNIPKLDDSCAGSFVNLSVDGLKGSGVILLFLLWVCESCEPWCTRSVRAGCSTTARLWNFSCWTSEVRFWRWRPGCAASFSITSRSVVAIALYISLVFWS